MVCHALFVLFLGGVVSVSGDGLGAAGLALWDAVHECRSVGREHELLLLNACRVADSLERISEELAVSGLRSRNSRGDEIANPLLVEHRQQLATFRQVLAALGVDKLQTVSSGPSLRDELAAAREARLRKA